MHEESAGTGVYVGPWVADLSGFAELDWDNFVVGFDEFDEIVILNILFGKCQFTHESGIGLPKDGVSIARNDLTRLKSGPDVVGNILLSPCITILIQETERVVKTLLIGEAVKWPSQPVHTGGERKIWVGKGRADQMGSVS